MEPNKNTTEYSITHTNINIEPSAVTYTIYGERIEDTMRKYLESKGITNVNVLVMLDRGTKNSYRNNNITEVKAFALLDINTPGVVSNTKQIPAHLRNKLNTSTKVKLDKTLTNLFLPLARTYRDNNDNLQIRCGEKSVGGNKYCYIALDIFRVLAYMLDAKHGVYAVEIADTTKAPDGQCIIRATKAKVFKQRHKDSGERLYDAFDNIKG